ncbi:MAG: hypothetical protein HYV45_02730 [Candidatus Moranbacteria bacterium]|nr:hypothetical protein [Candidatus Moranbacteria bacterium]
MKTAFFFAAILAVVSSAASAAAQRVCDTGAYERIAPTVVDIPVYWHIHEWGWNSYPPRVDHYTFDAMTGTLVIRVSSGSSSEKKMLVAAGFRQGNPEPTFVCVAIDVNDGDMVVIGWPGAELDLMVAARHYSVTESGKINPAESGNTLWYKTTKSLPMIPE